MSDCCCFIMVPEMHVALVENCGKFSDVVTPGLRWLTCPFEAVRAIVSLKVQQVDVKCDTKTKDNVFVSVNVAVLYKVVPTEVNKAFYKLTDHRAQMRSYVYDGIRSSFPKMDLDSTFSSKDEIANNVLESMRVSMSSYGYNVVDLLITDINPDATVQRAMNEINASQRLREAASYKADAEKILLVKAAEADSESKYLVGVGVAKQRKAIMDGLRSSISEFSTAVEGCGAKDVMDLLLLTQYFDTLKEIGSPSRNGGVVTGRTLFLPHGPSAVADLRKELSHSFMSGLSGTVQVNGKPAKTK